MPVPSLLPALLVHGYREVDGRRYYGVSKEKAAAREEYDERTTNNENVGLVESRLVCMWEGVCVRRGSVFMVSTYSNNTHVTHTTQHSTAQHMLVCNTPLTHISCLH